MTCFCLQIQKAADGSVISGDALLDNSGMVVTLMPDDVINITPTNFDPPQVMLMAVDLEIMGNVMVELIVDGVSVGTVSFALVLL